MLQTANNGSERTASATGAFLVGIVGGICGAIAGGASLYCIASRQYGDAIVTSDSDFPMLAAQIAAAVLGAAFGGIGGGLGGAVAGSYWPSRRAVRQCASTALGFQPRIVR